MQNIAISMLVLSGFCTAGSIFFVAKTVQTLTKMMLQMRQELYWINVLLGNSIVKVTPHVEVAEVELPD